MNFRLFFRRSGLAFTEILIAGFVLAVVAVCVLGWRLMSGPIDLEFARPYVQEALRDEQSGAFVKVDKIALSWPEPGKPILLGLQGARVYGGQGQIVASVEGAALGLDLARLFLGQVRPEILVIRRPSLTLIRHQDNSFDLGIADMERYGPPEPPDDTADDGGFYGALLAVLSAEPEQRGQSGLLSQLKRLEIEQASVLIDDRVLALSWVLPHTDVAVQREDGALMVDAKMALPSERPDPQPLLNIHAGLSLASRVLELQADLKHFDLRLLGRKIPELDVLKNQDVVFDAKLEAHIAEDMVVQRADLTLFSAGGGLNVPELSAESVAYKDFGVFAHYDADEAKLEIKKAQVTVGEDVTIEANAGLNLADDGSLNGPVRVEIADLAHGAIGPLWPAVLAEDNAKEWIVDKLSAGRFSNVYAQGDLRIAQGDGGWNFDVADLVAGFDFDAMRIDYRAPLKPVTEAKGHGQFNLKSETLRIDVESAKVLDLTISEANVELINIIEAGKGQADIHLKLQGPTKSLFAYIRDEPIGVNSGIDVANVRGQADMQVNIGLPTRSHVKIEDVDVNVIGTLREARLPNVVHGLALSEGPFDVRVKDHALRVKGKGRLGGEPITLDFHQYLSAAGKPYEMQVKAALTASPALREQFGMDLSSFLEGPAYTDVVYTEYAGGGAEAIVSADLTPARVFVEPFDYEKPPGVKGEATLKAVLKNGALKEIVDLKGSAPSLSIAPSVLRFRQQGAETELVEGKISRFTLGETVARLEFEMEPSGRTKIVMDGPFLDARPFMDNEGKDPDKPYTAPPMLISVAADRMRTTEKETVQYAKLYIDIDGQGKFNQMEMDAVAGKGDVYLRYKPDGAGKRVFRLEADDAGATLKAFDLYKGVRGGKLVIYGQPIRGVFDRNLVGVAEITDFKVVDAPALAQLLGAMSLPGLTQTLNGEGLGFTKMEANFDWLYRPNGSLLVLKDGRTSGNSLGLTFDGSFDHAAQTLDVSGTIIPLSGVNKMISDIPLVGDLLTGGTGALIAATYTMKGASAAPKVSVNPLSVLTPGILRRILFE